MCRQGAWRLPIYQRRRGRDARQAARELAGRIFCQHRTACGQCLACRKFRDGNLPDFLELDAKGGIKMEEVRRIPEFLSNKAMGGGARCI